MAVFALGYCVGNFHGSFERGDFGDGYGMYRHHGAMFTPNMFYQKAVMMDGEAGMFMSPATPAVPAATTTPTKK